MHPHIPETWVKSLAIYLHQIRGYIEMWRDLILRRQRENDQFIMQIATDGRYNLQLIQQCRLFLQVNIIEDISTAIGTLIKS